jgi:glycosyltransferase involved in cell wall biosynthesis
MGQYFSALGPCPAPRVLVEHEAGEKAARDFVDRHRGIRRVGYWMDWVAWRRFERNIVNQVQAVVTFTERDRQELARLGSSTSVLRIPFGTTVPKQPLNPLGSTPTSIMFVGSFRHPPNVDAATRLAKAIFPKVQHRYPDIHLYIVGEQPPAPLCRLADGNITVTGRVPDVAPYLDNAAAVIAPVRFGGGMRVKVLEALAAGKALVASPLAVEGLGLKNGEHALLADSDDDFSAAIIGLLDDPEQRRSLAERAREWARAHVDWNNSVRAYEDLYDQLLARQRATETGSLRSPRAALSGAS